jgi:hypothetical protein
MRNPEYNGKGFRGKGFFSVFFRGVGLAVLAGGLIYGVVILVFVARADHAVGKVVRIATVKNAAPLMDQVKGSGEYFYPVVQFRTASGKLVEFRAASGSQEAKYSVGDSLPVVYDPSDAKDGRIDTLWGVWGGPIILLGIGIIFLVLGLISPSGFGNTPRRLKPD